MAQVQPVTLSSQPNKRKRKEKAIAELNEVQSFWQDHYQFRQSDDTVSCNTVYILFCQEHPTSNINRSNFFNKSVQVGIWMTKKPPQPTEYYALPSSFTAQQHHNLPVDPVAEQHAAVFGSRSEMHLPPSATGAIEVSQAPPTPKVWARDECMYTGPPGVLGSRVVTCVGPAGSGKGVTVVHDDGKLWPAGWHWPYCKPFLR